MIKNLEVMSKTVVTGRIKNASEGPEQTALWVESFLCGPEYVSSDLSIRIKS